MSRVPTPSRRFSERADDYRRYRPGYPPALLELLRDATGLTPDHRVADVGAGAGHLSRLFLAHGNPVVAVEPDEAMRRAAQAELGGHPRFRSRAGSAEDTGLLPGSVDLVVAGQAFHWFDPEGARAEFARILAPGGRAVLAWYTRRSDRNAFHRDLEALLVEHGTDYETVRHDHLEPEVLRRFFTPDRGSRVLEHGQSLDREGFLGLIRTLSYLPAPGTPGYEPALEAARALFRRHEEEGRIRIEYAVPVHWGRIRAPSTDPASNPHSARATSGGPGP